MASPSTILGLIDQYAAEGNRPALLGIRAAQAQQLVEMEQSGRGPDILDRSKMAVVIARYYRANISYIDQVLAKMD